MKFLFNPLALSLASLFLSHFCPLLSLSLISGIFVVKIHRDGAAFRDGRLRVGDKIISINDVVLDGLRHEEVCHELRQQDYYDDSLI